MLHFLLLYFSYNFLLKPHFPNFFPVYVSLNCLSDIACNLAFFDMNSNIAKGNLCLIVYELI